MAYFVYGLFSLFVVVLTSTNFLMSLDEVLLAWAANVAIIFFGCDPRSSRSAIY